MVVLRLEKLVEMLHKRADGMLHRRAGRPLQTAAAKKETVPATAEMARKEKFRKFCSSKSRFRRSTRGVPQTNKVMANSFCSVKSWATAKISASEKQRKEKHNHGNEFEVGKMQTNNVLSIR